MIIENRKNAIKLLTETRCDQWIVRTLTAQNKCDVTGDYVYENIISNVQERNITGLQKSVMDLNDISARIFDLLSANTSEIIMY